MSNSAITLPRSATHGGTALAAFSGFIIAVLSVLLFQPFGRDTDTAIIYSTLYIICITVASLLLVDLLLHKVHRRSSTGLDFTRSTPSWRRTLTKLAGLYATVAVIAFFYWLLPEYRGDFYSRYYIMLKLVLPVWLILAVPYFYYIDRHMQQPEDGYWHFGQLILLQYARTDKTILTQHALSWLVKGFFLPLMYVYFCNDLIKLMAQDFTRINSFPLWFDFLHQQLYFLDVGLVSMSYMLSLRLIDTHFRSTEPTLLGWVSALVCYQPFWSLAGSMYFAYEIAPLWGTWLWNAPIIYGIWGSCILFLVAIYVWATIMFGARFSNLTHRGIITNGPYRYTKHPAYLAKNLSYWFISIPFISHEGLDAALRHSLLLLGVNAIYLLRAKTEERHLSQDSVYLAYANWISKNGILRWMQQVPLLQQLQFRPSYTKNNPGK